MSTGEGGGHIDETQTHDIGSGWPAGRAAHRPDGPRTGAAVAAAGTGRAPDAGHGTARRRLNLIVLGDGYQWDQQSLFFEDVDRNLAVMWATEPFKSYRNYINVYAVEIASIDYGVRRDPDGRVRTGRHDPGHR